MAGKQTTIALALDDVLFGAKESADSLRETGVALMQTFHIHQLLLKGTKSHSIATYPITRSQSHLNDLFITIDAILRAVEAGAFWPNRGWACATWQYAHACGGAP